MEGISMQPCFLTTCSGIWSLLVGKVAIIVVSSLEYKTIKYLFFAVALLGKWKGVKYKMLPGVYINI